MPSVRFGYSLLTLVLFAFPALVRSCADHPNGETHTHERRTKPNDQLTPPSRPLEWGDINILHTTDTHGWLLGHKKSSFPEPNYSGDFGDFASFVTHMKEIADKRGVDLLLVDSGDLHDGTGLTDGFPPGGVDAHDANQFVLQLPYDIMAIGNHELYIYANTFDMHQNFAPALKGRYLSSNVNITVPDGHGNPVSVPVGNRFSKFKTTHGRRITAFGVLFDFDDNDRNTTVQKVEDMVKEEWFLEAIQEEPDVFLLVGHMPVNRDNWPLVFNAIRQVHPLTPIMILGGHTHIRDCVQLDDRSMSIESGRYMETIGWMSAKLPRKRALDKKIEFSRRYLDANTVTYEYHTKLSAHSFATTLGQRISKGLNDLAKRFNLSFQFGVAPQDYLLFGVPYPSNNSILSLIAKEVLPFSLTVNNTRASLPKLIMTNSGSLRFDLYGGSFTRDDQLTVSPFADRFIFFPDVPLSLAKRTFDTLNNDGSNQRRGLSSGFVNRENKQGLSDLQYVDSIFKKWLERMNQLEGIERRAAKNLTLGYVTQDSCPGIGDDVPHTPIPFFDSPDFIASDPPAGLADDAPIDFVFVDFIANQLVEIMNSLQSNKTYAVDDAQPYSPFLASEVLGIYAQGNWN